MQDTAVGGIIGGVRTAEPRRREPLYVRIYNEIGARIVAGTLSPTGRLPPERIMSEELGVSRATVRRALSALEAEGIIEAVQGRGTFLTTPPLVEPPNALMSFTELVRDRGTTPGAQVLDAQVRRATIDEAAQFGIAAGSEMFDLVRLRTIDSLAVAIDRTVTPTSLVPGLADLDWASASLYEALTLAGHRPVRADYVVEAQAANLEHARRLQISLGAPVLTAWTTAFSRAGRLVQTGEMTYRADRYRFHATLVAEPDSRRTPVPGAGES